MHMSLAQTTSILLIIWIIPSLTSVTPTKEPTTGPGGPSTTDMYTSCANYNSYCLIGLSPNEYASFIGARYQYKGIDEGCKYFENTQLPETFENNVYIHWDDGLNKWYIGSSLSSTDYWAYCTYSSLDACTVNTWSRFDGTSTQTDYSMSIVPCTYDNTQCLAQYNHTFDKGNHNEQDFCIRNTHHRSVNVGISGSFSVSGCSEEKAYYTGNGQVISWDNEMNAWYMSSAVNVVAWSHFAFCSYNDLKMCSNNWYIWDGEDTVKDSAVISGLCNTCTDTKHDTFCIYGGIGRDEFELMVGIYEYDTCVELMHSYNHTQYDDYYANNLTHGGNLTLHYFCDGNSWRIDIDYNRNYSGAVCDEFDDIMDCSGNWAVYDAAYNAWNVKQSIQSGSCDVIYQQCLGSHSDEQYLCITEDENDESVLNNGNYYQYVAGEYKYVECDDQGFPIYVRHRDNSGNYLDETWFNYSLMTWDSSGNLFSVHTAQKGLWLYGRSLLVELCDTFWNLYDNDTDDWIPSPSIRSSAQKCNFANNSATIFDAIATNVIVLVIVLVLFVLCCIAGIGLLFFFCKRCNSKKGRNKDVTVRPIPNTPSTPSTPQKKYQHHSLQNVASSAQRVEYVTMRTMPNTPKTPETPKPKQNISPETPNPILSYILSDINLGSYAAAMDKKGKKKDVEAPPPYNPQYDSLANIGPGVSFGVPAAAFNANVNDENVNQSAIAKWNRDDIIAWIYSISLSPQWKEIVINCVLNGQYDGNDILKINSGADIAKLFAIRNPMLCSRLWKELKKIK